MATEAPTKDSPSRVVAGENVKALSSCLGPETAQE